MHTSSFAQQGVVMHTSSFAQQGVVMHTSSFAHARMNSLSITGGSKRGRVLYMGESRSAEAQLEHSCLPIKTYVPMQYMSFCIFAQTADRWLPI